MGSVIEYLQTIFLLCMCVCVCDTRRNILLLFENQYRYCVEYLPNNDLS